MNDKDVKQLDVNAFFLKYLKKIDGLILKIYYKRQHELCKFGVEFEDFKQDSYIEFIKLAKSFKTISNKIFEFFVKRINAKNYNPAIKNFSVGELKSILRKHKNKFTNLLEIKKNTRRCLLENTSAKNVFNNELYFKNVRFNDDFSMNEAENIDDDFVKFLEKIRVKNYKNYISYSHIIQKRFVKRLISRELNVSEEQLAILLNEEDKKIIKRFNLTKKKLDKLKESLKNENL